jgi:hypothetical protein
MSWAKIVVSSICCAAGFYVTGAAQTPAGSRWCAEPRPDEPLLGDAKGLRNPADTSWATTRYVFKIPPVRADAEIAVVRDEAICRSGAEAYAAHMRGIFGEGWPVKPVLVIRVGDMYLADDLGPRDGDHAVWTALLLNNKWQPLYEYGGGS